MRSNCNTTDPRHSPFKHDTLEVEHSSINSSSTTSSIEEDAEAAMALELLASKGYTEEDILNAYRNLFYRKGARKNQGDL